MAELHIVSGPGAGERIDVSREVVIGREEGHGLGGDPQLSRRHARITPGEGGGLLLEDLGSTNGTLVNGYRITAPSDLYPGDKIELGSSTLEVGGAAGRPAAGAAAAAPPAQSPLPAGLASAHPAAKQSGVKPPFAALAAVLALLVGLAVGWAVWGGDDDESSSDAAAGGEPAFDGTLYTLSNGFAPRYQNSVLAYRTSAGLLPMRLREYPTGGTGARNINLNLAIDGEQELNYDEERKLLFAVNPGTDSIAVFRVADDGTLSAVDGSPFKSGGIAPISTGVSGDRLLVVNKGHDGVRRFSEEVTSVTQLRIGSDGKLSVAGRAIPLPNDTNPTQVLVTRDGELAVVTLERGDHYLTLIRQGDGTFRQGERTPITDEQRRIGGPGGPPGGGGPPPGQDPGGGPPGGQDGGGGPPEGQDGGGGPPGGQDGGGPELGSIPEGALGMVEHPQEPVIYSELPNYSLLMVHEYDDAGRLRFVRGVRIPKGFLACWAKVSADGRFLYVANTGEHTIAVFDVSDARRPRHLQSLAVPGPGGVASIQIDDEAGVLYALDHFDPLDLEPGQSNRLHAFKIGEDGRLSARGVESLRLPVGADVSPIGALWLPR